MLFLQFSYIERDEGGKPDRKPFPYPYGLRNPYRNLISENCQDYVQKPQRNCTFMNSVHVPFRLSLWPLSLNHSGLNPLCLRHFAANKTYSTTLRFTNIPSNIQNKGLRHVKYRDGWLILK
jgi:hypothetical protein